MRIGGNLIDDPSSSDPSELILTSGGGLTGNVIGNLNIDGTLIFDRADSFTYAGDLSGSGTIVKQGTGDTTLSGTFNYTGDLQILAGTVNLTGDIVNTGTTSIGGSRLRVNGMISSDVEVGAGGALGGAGTIDGDLTVNSGGALGPGNSPGTLNVSGNVTFAAGSTYQVETLPDGTGDRVAVTGGSVTIQNGAGVTVLAGGMNYAPSTNYTIITATGGVNGAFSAITSNLAFLDPSLAYTANSAVLTLTLNGHYFEDFAESPNQASFAGALQNLPTDNAVFLALLNSAEGDVADNFNALTGEAHASLQSAGLTGSNAFLGQLEGRLTDLSDGPRLVQVASLSSDAGAPGTPRKPFLGGSIRLGRLV